LAGVESVEWKGDRGTFRTAKVGAALVDVVKLLESRGAEIVDLQVHKPTLEDVFIELTGSSLRE